MAPMCMCERSPQLPQTNLALEDHVYSGDIQGEAGLGWVRTTGWVQSEVRVLGESGLKAWAMTMPRGPCKLRLAQST